MLVGPVGGNNAVQLPPTPETATVAANADPAAPIAITAAVATANIELNLLGINFSIHFALIGATHPRQTPLSCTQPKDRSRHEDGRTTARLSFPGSQIRAQSNYMHENNEFILATQAIRQN